MISFAAVVPHSPFLLPTIGKEKTDKLQKTLDAYAQLEKDLYVLNPEVVVIIAPHGSSLQEAMTINLSPTYQPSYKELGDFSTPDTQYQSDFLLINRMQGKMRKDIPLMLTSDPGLGYASAIPLTLLTGHLQQKFTILPIITSGLDPKAHYEFGKQIKEQLVQSNKRVAILASADLSHTLSSDAPGGFAKEGEQFDELVQQLLTTRNTAGFLSMDLSIASAAKECGLRPICTLLGMLDGVPYTPKVHSYEHPFGVGYLVANLAIT